MRRKILTVITLAMSFYIIFSFITGMLNGVFQSKSQSGKDYLVKLENKSLADLQDKIDTYQNDILNKKNDNIENQSLEKMDINYSKYYENTIFMGDSITEALSEFGILDSYNVIANKGDTVVNALQNMDKLQGINPKNLVLLYGMNDVIAFDSNSSEESSNALKEKYIELINSIKSVLPKTNIYLISPLPVMDNLSKYILTNNFIILLLGLICSTKLIKICTNKIKSALKENDIFLIATINLLILIISTAYLVGASYNPFLYFRF